MNILWIFLTVILLLIIAVLLLILFARLRIAIVANNNDIIKVKLYLYGVPIYSYSAKQKQHHKRIKLSRYSKKNIEKRRKKKSAVKSKKRGKSSGTGVSYNISSILKFITNLLKTFALHYAKKLKITIHRFNISIATEDAASTAIIYGAVIQSTSYLLEFLNNTTDLTVPSSATINVVSDFCGTTTQYDIKISLIIRLRRLLSLLYRSGLRSPADIEKFFK